jgi:hypothetical protein
MIDHYADAVFSEPGRCWRMIHDGEGSGRPTFCEEPVVWVGNTRLVGGKQIRVWSCEGHVEGVEHAEHKSRVAGIGAVAYGAGAMPFQYVVRFIDPEREPETALSDDPWVTEGDETAFYTTSHGGVKQRIAFLTSEIAKIESPQRWQ